MNLLEGKVNVVIIGGDIASDRNLTLIINIKKINNNTKVLVIADEDSDKTRILGYGADEFSLKPMSLENIADKVLMLISREKVRENRWMGFEITECKTFKKITYLLLY